MLILIDQIRPSPFATRPKPLEVNSLAESIKKFGQLQPIKVRPVDERYQTEGGFLYECVFGTRRLAACRQAGLTEVEATIQDVDDRQARLQIWEENQQREDLDDIARGEFLKAYKADYGLTWPQMEQIFHIDEKHLQRLVYVSNEPEEIRQAVASRQVSASAAFAVRGLLGDEEARIRLIKEAATEDLSERDTIARARAIKYHQAVDWHKRKDEDWQKLPSVRKLVDGLKEWREWIRIGQAMQDEAKLAPEAKQFIANKLGYLIRRLQEWKDELESEEE